VPNRASTYSIIWFIKFFFKAFGVILGLCLTLVLIVYISLAGRDIAIPERFMVQFVEKVNIVPVIDSLKFDKAFVRITPKTFKPVVTLSNVLISSQQFGKFGFPEVEAQLTLAELLQGKIRPSRVELFKPDVLIFRDEFGHLGFGFLDLKVDKEIKPQSYWSLSGIFKMPFFSRLDSINTQDMKLRYEDKRNSESVSFVGVQASLFQKKGTAELNISAGLKQVDRDLAKVYFSLTDLVSEKESKVIIKFNDLDVENLSNQVHSLGWLKHFDGLVSGAITGELNSSGSISKLAGALTLEDGFIRTLSGESSYYLDTLNTHIRYDSIHHKMYFDNISIKAPELNLEGMGNASIVTFKSGIPDHFVGQLKFEKIQIIPRGVIENVINFTDGLMDFRYSLQNSKVEIGQLILRQNGSKILSSGLVSSEVGGWKIQLDSELSVIEHSDLLKLWPVYFKPRSREWFLKNVKSGFIQNGRYSIRMSPGLDPKYIGSFDFFDAKINVLKGHPAIRNGLGYGSINGKRFIINLQKGFLHPTSENPINLSGSTLSVADTTKKPATGKFSVSANGSIKSVLNELNKKPLLLFASTKINPDLLLGNVNLIANIALPLKPFVEMKPKDITVEDVKGDLYDLLAKKIIPGRTISSKVLNFQVNEKLEFKLFGNSMVDELPLQFKWSGKSDFLKNGKSSVSGRFKLAKSSLKSLNINVPSEIIEGVADAFFTITLAKDQSPKLVITSDLKGLEIKVDTLSWHKEKKEKGKLVLNTVVEDNQNDIYFSLSTERLTTSAKIKFGSNGVFERLILDNLEVDGTSLSSVEILGGYQDKLTKINIKTSDLDIRKFNFLNSGNGSGKAVIVINTEKLIVNDKITLINFMGHFNDPKTDKNVFSGKLNNIAEVSGTFVKHKKKIGVVVKSPVGGEVLQTVGLIKGARGGDLFVELIPTDEDGIFSGSLDLKNVRLKKAPILADLLSATSIFGLIEQLSGDGILFSNAEAEFTLQPEGVVLRKASAIGASLGVSMDGIYDTKRENLEMQGVISPMYTVNGMILGKLFAPREGEGLVGFNYSIEGPIASPKVSINPLSILTPGIFREIFRRSMPKLKK